VDPGDHAASLPRRTKKHRRWTHRFKNDPPADEEPDDHELEREVDRSRLAKILAACLAKLAPAARDAVVLRYHQDLSYDEAPAISPRRLPSPGNVAGPCHRRTTAGSSAEPAAMLVAMTGSAGRRCQGHVI
jgi:hypothetical protein